MVFKMIKLMTDHANIKAALWLLSNLSSEAIFKIIYILQ